MHCPAAGPPVVALVQVLRKHDPALVHRMAGQPDRLTNSTISSTKPHSSFRDRPAWSYSRRALSCLRQWRRVLDVFRTLALLTGCSLRAPRHQVGAMRALSQEPSATS
jgi:hypothetical protein